MANYLKNKLKRIANLNMSSQQGATLPDMASRLRTRNLSVSGFVNIGSGRGDDTPFFMSIWPGMKSLLIDMDTRFQPEWDRLSKTHPDIKNVVCAAGDHDGEGAFLKSNDVGGALSSNADVEGGTSTPIRKVDTLVDEFEIPGPYFLKFDTHGVELDILAGAEETLKNTSVIMMEVYNFKLNFVGGKNLTFDEMSLHMKALGFRCIDFCDPLFRPGDHALWQMHMIFVRDDHISWNRNSYSA